MTDDQRTAALEEAGRNLLTAVTNYLVPPPGAILQVQRDLMTRCHEMRTAIAGEAQYAGPTREQLQADLAECRARAKRLRSQLRAAQRHPKVEQEPQR